MPNYIKSLCLILIIWSCSSKQAIKKSVISNNVDTITTTIVEEVGDSLPELVKADSENKSDSKSDNNCQTPAPEKEDAKIRPMIIAVTNKNIIKEESSDLSFGNVIYQTPDTMIVLKESKIVARIFKGKLDTLSVTSDMTGKVKVVNINVTTQMDCKLVDPSPDTDRSFDIKALNSDQQIVDNGVWTEWNWSVIPLKAGKKELKLVVSIIRNGVVKEQVWTDKIEVKSNPVKKTLNFWENNWQYLLGTFLLPLFFYLRKKWLDKKKSNQ